MTDNRVLESGAHGGWFVSSFTDGGGACVEVKFADPDVVLVRDSKDRLDERPILSLPSSGWAALLRDIAE